MIRLALIAALLGPANGPAGKSVPPSPLFDFYPGNTAAPPSVDRLSSTLCINGTCVAPTLRYKGGDATTSSFPAWTYGETLTKTEVSADVTPNKGSPLLGLNDDSVLFNDADYFAASNTTFADIATEDIVFELVVKAVTPVNGGLISKRSGAGAIWALTQATTTVIRLNINDGTDAAAIDCPVVAGSWYHLIYFVDRSGSGVCYTNSVVGSAVSVAAVDTLTNANTFYIGRDGSGAFYSLNTLAYFAMWKSASGWLDTHLQAAVALDRFSRLTGVRATSKGTATPTTMTRASAATLRKYNGSSATTMFNMGGGWPRVSKNATLSGYLSEPVATNFLLQSEDVATSWTEADSGDTQSLNSVTFPDGTAVMDGNIADGSDGDHGFSQATGNLTAAAWTFSAFAKAGNKSWVYLSDDTVANATSYFDLTACAACTADGFTLCSAALGTKGAGAAERFAYNFGGGVCRVGISFTGTVAAHTLKMLTADADTDKTVTGDAATVNTSWGGMQAELWATPTSYIRTTTATVTRAKDLLIYSPASNVVVGRGSIVCSVQMPSYVNPVVTILDASDTATNNILRMNVTTSTGTLNWLMSSAGTTFASLTGTTDLTSGARAVVSFTWRTDRVDAYVNGSTEGTPDTSATTPTDILDELVMGNTGTLSSSNAQMNGLVERCRVFNRVAVVK